MNISRSRGRIARPTVFFLVFLFCSAAITPTMWGQIPLPDFAASNARVHLATKVVSPNSGPVALLSIPLSVNDWTAKPQIRQQNLKSITFILENLGGLDLTDFLPLTKDGTSGIALYAESGDVPEFFNYAEGDATSDIPMILKSAPAVVPLATGYQITLEPVQIAGSTQLPINSDGFPEFYIVAKTSIELRQGDAFEAYMTPGMIRIEDRDPSVGVFRRFDYHFPSEDFATNFSTQLGGLAILPEFRNRAIFQGDIVQIYNRTTVGQRIINRSEPTTILAMDLVGAPTEEYFVKEVRVNFIGIDLYPISWLYGPQFLPGSTALGWAGIDDIFLGYVNGPSRFIGNANPYDTFPNYYIHVPKFLQNPSWYEVFTPPLAKPDERGLSIFNRANPNRAKYLADRGMDVPTLVSPEIFLDLLQDGEGGIFLFTEGSGGVQGLYESNLDRRLTLGDGVRFETLDVTTLPREIINRLLPATLLKSRRSALPRSPITGEVQLSFLLDDVPLDFLLTPGLAELMQRYGQYAPPQGYKIASGVVDAYRVAPRDFSWDTGKYVLGLSREMIDALLADAALESADANEDGMYDGDGIDNSTELFGRQLITGFTMVLPLSHNNPKELLRVPSSDSVALDTDRPELYIAVKTSDKIRNLYSVLPFILPGDITIGKQLERFVRGATDIETLPSYSRVGQPRLGYDRLLPERPGETLTHTNPLIGRPRPTFTFQDLTIPGPGDNATNNNILSGPQLGSPPKAVIGINAVDYGQNTNLMFNNTVGTDEEAVFFTEGTVLDTLTVDFLPAPGESVFNPRIINGATNAQGIDSSLNNMVSEHQVILYEDDDTPVGDGFDNDGDGMIDEEVVNMIDDEGDGLIDEDCGDGDPRGINGVFDAYDNFILPIDDHYGSVRIPVSGPNTWASMYKRAVNHGLFVPDPLNPTEAGMEITEDLAFSPLVPISNGAYRAVFDLRVLKIGSLPWAARDCMSWLNLGETRQPNWQFRLTGDKDTPVIDLTLPLAAVLPYLWQPSQAEDDGKFYLPDWKLIVSFDGKIRDAIISAAGAAGNPKPINLATIFSKNGTPIGIVPSEDSVSLRALRFADPYTVFNRMGLVPMLANDQGISESNPEGGNATADLSQKGWYVTTGIAPEQLYDYFEQIVTSISDAHDAYMQALQDAIDAWNEEVEAYNEERAEAEDPSSVEPPEFDPDSLPEPTEVTITDPEETLQLRSIPNDEDISYEYQIQIPDEEYGVLRGNDYYVVLRAAQTAQVGDRFQVRMGAGAITYLSFTDCNQVYSDRFPGKSTGSVVTSALVVRSANVPPTFKFLSPKAGRNYADEYQQYEISWEAVDPDNDATITLYVDTDNKGFDGYLLVAGLTEGVDTRYKINLTEDIPGFDPALDYYIYASITDGISDPQLIYADGPIALASTGSPGTGGIPVSPTGDLVDYYKLVSDGRIFNLGEAAGLSDVTALGGTTLAIDMELTADYSGAVVLAADGRVFAVGNVGLFSDKVAADGEIVFPSNPIDNPSSGVTINSACDLEVDFERGTIFILDMDGDFVALGTEPARNLAPTIRLPGVSIYRDMELTPDGEGMYFLTFAGDIYGSGTASGYNRSLGFGEDLARDMELVIAGRGVSGVIVLDAYGRMYGLGADLPPYCPPISDEPVFRSLAKMAGKERAYLLADGGGHIYAATHEAVIMPRDAAVFGDEPGIQDDRVVDIESASYNLRDIPGLINDLLLAYSSEDMKSIVALTASSYSDDQGMNRAKLSSSLGGFFDFYHMKSMRVGTAQDALMVTFQGNKVIVTAQVETTYFLPQVNRLVAEIEEGQTVYADIQGFPNTSGSEPGFPFSQTVTIREVGDGRGWNLSVYDIDNILNQSLTDFSWDEFEGAENTTKLKALIAAPGNRRVEYFGFQSKGAERQRRVKFSYHGPGRLNTFMFWFQQMVYNIYYGPPVMEMVWYPGDIASWRSSAFQFQMENINGKFQITGIRMPQRMRVNSNGTEISANSDTEPGPLEEELEVEIPDGFSFSDGAMVVTLQPGDADIVLESADRLAVTSKNQGIMNLGGSTDIFAISAQEILNNVSRFSVLADSLDTEADTVFSTNVVPGNSYFVILRDGVHFALMRILQRMDLPQGETPEEIYFVWVCRSDFVLPKNF
ncbi:MAG TPA: hypothetical protein PLQ35_05845 [bacterium]|nr:hypothetical protein [bacterium]HQL61799.1 hypothetical protein [bacterium]